MLSAGYAQADITPPADVTLQGYEFRFSQLPPGNDGVHDPLLCRALAFHDGDKPAVIVSLDICIVSVAMARHLRARVAERVGTTPDRVLLCTTHTHSGPDLDEPQ
ncbi:MAG: neutral/alkaline non-lysosomal ceramidase N-terminal domain-containing protein, partial [Phycisphaerae bacterium]